MSKDKGGQAPDAPDICRGSPGNVQGFRFKKVFTSRAPDNLSNKTIAMN